MSNMREIVHIEMPELEMNAPEAWWDARFLDREWLIQEMQIATGVPHITLVWMQLKYGDEKVLIELGKLADWAYLGIINWLDRRASAATDYELATIDLAKEALRHWRSHRNVA